MKKKSVPNVKI